MFEKTTSQRFSSRQDSEKNEYSDQTQKQTISMFDIERGKMCWCDIEKEKTCV